MKKCLLLSCMLASLSLSAQVGIGNTDPKAALDITASNLSSPSSTDGLLVPRVQTLNTSGPGADQDSMIVYLTTNVTIAFIDYTKGFYYWDANASSWISVFGAKRINDLVDGKSDQDGTDNGSSLFLGEFAGAEDDGSNNKNVGIGYYSLAEGLNRTDNTAVGYNSLTSNKYGNNNTAIGSEVMYLNQYGDENTAVGKSSLYSSFNGNGNTAIGFEAGKNNSGSNNTFIGAETNSSSSSSGMVHIGYQAGSFGAGDNTLIIENTDANVNSALIYGYFGSDNTSNGNILRTNSEFQIGNPSMTGYALPTTDGTSGQVLTSNGNGYTTWETPTSTSSSSNYSLSRATLSANQGPSGKVLFNVETFDILDDFNPSTSRFTVPEDGIYRINVQIYSSTTGTSQGIQIYINGINTIRSSNGQYTRSIDTMLQLNASDYIEVYSTAFNIQAAYSFFEVERKY